ncbi:hypothetical protein OEB96_28995 [Paraliomyxa miuraensis]|nr:hypothetical protein [Paraliomyxa miuraensis]
MGLVVGWAVLAAGCREEPQGREDSGLEALQLLDVNPKIIVPGSTVVIEGRSFLDQPLGVSWLRLQGGYSGYLVDSYLPATFIDFDRMEIQASAELLRLLGPLPGTFSGRIQVEVDFVPDGTRHASVPLSMTLELAEHLQPQLDELVAGPTIYVNEPIEIEGSGFLLGGDEGTTYAVVEGCFTPAGGASCLPVPSVAVPVRPAQPHDRSRGIFAFAPEIAGIEAGHFDGTVTLRNEHGDGQTFDSGLRPMAFDMIETVILGVGGEDGDDVGTLGRRVPITGGGFVEDGPEGGTLLAFTGTFDSDDGTQLSVDVGLVPKFVDGHTVTYVINEEDALSGVLDVREARGTLVGELVPEVDFRGQHVVGLPTQVSFRLEPVKQVVYLQWSASYKESLRLFGLRALDERIRQRVLDVLRRDYASINVDFRTEPPEDYEVYSTIVIAGPDPNGQGLLGYDNTPGKDTGNERLNDTIGGVNAETLETGQPGFGGVFMESLFSFSLNPPVNTVPTSPVATANFDLIFDPFRSDRGQPVTEAELAGIVVPVPTSGAFCPGYDRPTQMACAVFVLGSVVGSTVSHELGHSLGLADPYGVEFHNVGDLPNRLMDTGSARSFEERAELMGQGPARFCQGAYDYLREILPTTEADPLSERPPC